MGHRSVRLKVRRRKVAHLRAYSRQFTVHNCTIPKANKEDIIDIKTSFGVVKGTKGGGWTIPEEGHKQPKRLHRSRRGTKWFKYKDGHYEELKWYFPSELKSSESVKMNHVEYMEAYVQQKLAKWVRKNPPPIKEDNMQPDMFEGEYMTPWNDSKNTAEERIRDFVVAVYDKLNLVGRYKKSDTDFKEKDVAKIKDSDGEGHHINELDPKKSKLLKKAQKITDKEKRNNPKLVATRIQDHKKKKGRIILPNAA